MSKEFSLFGKLNKYLEDGHSFDENDNSAEESIDLDDSVKSTKSPEKTVRKSKKKTTKKIAPSDCNENVSDSLVSDFLSNSGKKKKEYEKITTKGRGRGTGRGRVKQLRSCRVKNAPIIIIDSPDSDVEVISNVSIGNESFNLENCEMSVKIIWKGKIEKFTLRKYQKFGDLMKILGERENNQNLLLNINNKIIQPEDTPDSIGYEITDFINARVMNSIGCEIQPLAKNKDKDEIELKIQLELAKKPFIVHINKFKPMKTLVFLCSEEWKCDTTKIKFYFDGEIVDLNMAANDLELEGGEIIDCRVIK